jgi:DNA polymerase
MKIVTLDFETYYDRDYSLSKMTTEEYIRDDRFEVIGLAVKKEDKPTKWVQGQERVKSLLSHIDLSQYAILCHNTAFDGAILSWRYGVNPKLWLDTMCMARAIHGVEKSVSLKAVAERYGVGVKGDEVVRALAKRLTDFTDIEIADYARYARNDVDLTYKIFNLMARNQFPRQELRLIDRTLRMFIEPTLDLDLFLLEQHLEEVRERKDKLLRDANITDKKDLMSNQKFAGLLEGLDVTPPMKISPTTGKETFAFAKSDEDFKALAEHPDDRVQTLVNARMGTKSTLEETRTERFISIAKRGLLPVPIRYYAAHTGRWGGQDKINLQNLPSRGPNAKKLKSSIIAPEGHVLIDADSAQIEARVLAWLAEQTDLVSQFANGEDVYIKMASRIYNMQDKDVVKEQRFVGKTTVLGAGYGMGHIKFRDQLKNFGTEVTETEARRIINIYRNVNSQIQKLWDNANFALEQMCYNSTVRLGKEGVLQVKGEENAIRLPSGLHIFYEDLKYTHNEDTGRDELTYKVRRGRNKIYGGKVIENVCQAIARCIIGEQLLNIAKKYKVVLTVHDSIVCCVEENKAEAAQKYIETCMRTAPEWAHDLPIDCESGIGKSYGECE